MTPKRLPADEFAQLSEILANISPFNSLNVQLRRAILFHCKVDDCFDNDPEFYNLPTTDFIEQIYIILIQQKTPLTECRFADFLHELLLWKQDKFDTDAVMFIVDLVKKLRQPSPIHPNHLDINALLGDPRTTRRNPLRERRQQQTTSSHPSQLQTQPTSQIAKQRLVAYDLESIVGKFMITIKRYGIHHYATASEDRDILLSYIIERLTVELKHVTNQTCRSADYLWLTEMPIPNPPRTVIEQSFLDYNNIDLAYLFQEDTKQNIVLMICNPSIPELALTPEITAFTTRLNKIAAPYFKERCLLVIWANIGPDKEPLTHPELTVLPPLKAFDQTDLQIWLKKLLTEIGLDSASIQHYLSLILAKKGRLIPTYIDLNQIIRTINESSQGATA